MATQVFISYSSKDSKIARTICSSLESRGLSCWIASRDVEPGENFMDAIVRAIHAAKVMVLVFSENANNSDEIKRELVLAGNAKITVIPVRVEDVAPRDSFAYQLATRQWIDLFIDWENQLDRLSSWIAHSLELATPGGAAKPEDEPAVASYGTSTIDTGQTEAQSGQQDAAAKLFADKKEPSRPAAAAPPPLPKADPAVEAGLKPRVDQQKAGTRTTRRGLMIGGSAAAVVAAGGGAALYASGAINPGPPPPGLIRTFSTSDTVPSVAFLPDGRSAIAADSPLSLWEVATGSLIRKFSKTMWPVAVSPDGRALIATQLGDAEDKLGLYDLLTGANLRTFHGHSGFIPSVAISADGRSMLSGSRDKTVKLWNLSTGALVRTFLGHTGEVLGVAFAPNGRAALSCDLKVIKLWDVASGALLRTFGADSVPLSIAFSPDGRTVLSGGYKDVTLWDAQSGAALKTFSGHQSLVKSVAFSPDGHTALSGSEDATVRTWDIASGNALRLFGVPRPYNSSDKRGVESVAFSPDGRTALSGAETMKLWDLNGPPLLGA